MAQTLYTLKVFVVEGVMTDRFMDANPELSRTIEIKGNQTLADLHTAIFLALGREDEHLYEFDFGDIPRHPDNDRYGLILPIELGFGPEEDEKPVVDAEQTKLDSLRLEPGMCFGYLFDFGDGWYHTIDVVDVGEATAKTRYPRVTESVGDSPPQYVDWDEEEEEWDEEEEEE